MAARTPESGAAGRQPPIHASPERHPLIVWRFTDGKPGHENQTQGLLAALRKHVPLNDFLIHVADCRAGLLSCLTGRAVFGKEMPDPDLIVGAGHATHLPMLNARRLHGGRVVVLMKPTLPTAWFDLCVIPAHDRPRRAGNILVSRGVLNRVRPGAHSDAHTGLILVGGPSDHVAWSTESVVAQIGDVLARSPGMHWTLTTSRRTPAGFLPQLDNVGRPGLTIAPCEKTGPDWLPERLARAAQVWVTQDSVSMVYEALTAGAAVGLLVVPWRNDRDRLARGVAQLEQDGLITAFDAWQQGRALAPPAEPFNEAERCATWIAERWLNAA